jgi:hypothetical protein
MGKRDLTPEELAERETDPSELTRRVYAHPWRTGAGTGLLIAAWVLWLSDGSVVLALAAGLGMLLLYGFLWRPGGPGQRLRRYILRRFPKHDP